ncbi:MAG TPA: ABC-F family ATP-binding cassette domain-containing protein [Actinomycetota bacterium]|nr:ABC-F family ATP-binding cassette domain-containing protein [Actinomycetota bacterium]
MLSVENLTVEVAGEPVVEDASLTLHPGDKAGLVGRNGAGKTSLLKVLAGEEPVAQGRIVRRGAVGHLRQDPRLHGARDSSTALRHIISGRGLDHEAMRLEKLRLQVEENPSMRNVGRYSRAEESFRVAGGYSAEATARRIAAGLGLSEDRLDLPIRALSGGERRRVELARILFAGSDLLLLDEPTNHLDTDAKAWLMKFLRSYKGALLVVSHDLYLLDEAITRVIHLDEGELIEYRGTYSEYRTARKRDEERRTKVAVRQEAEITRLSSLADSMRHQTAKRARKAKTLDTRVQRLREHAITAPAKERRIAVRFPEPPRGGRVLLEIDGLTKGYGSTPVFSDVSFWVERGERLLILGLNGAGKTTLLRVLAGITEPDEGTVTVGEGASIGYYAQEHEGIVPGLDVLSHMRAGTSVPDQQLRKLLGMFTLTGERAFQDAGTLSGGEKTKLALAQLVAGRHNLLLLDEPTNNLDPPSLRAVGEALREWPGAMVIVSHDRDFVSELGPDRVLTMPEGSLDHWNDELLELVSLA